MMRSTSERHAMMVLGGIVLLGMARLGGATSFADVTSTAGVGDTGDGIGTAWADFDGDGDLDLYVTNSDGANALYQNDGDGTFSDVTSTAGVGDTSNTLPGVRTTGDRGSRPVRGELWHGQHAVPERWRRHLFQRDQHGRCWGYRPRHSRGVGGLQRRRDLDLHAVNYDGDTNTLYQNDGDGIFSDVTSTAGVGDTGDSDTAWADFTETEIWTCTWRTCAANTLYQNNGNGTFSSDQHGR